MAGTTCIYKSVTLQAGETFVIPPGGELIGASNETAIVSSCDEEFNLEEIQCYGFLLGGNERDGGLDQYLEGEAIRVIGYTLNGNEYPFIPEYSTDPSGIWLDTTGLLNAIKSIPGILDVNIGLVVNTRAKLWYFIVKTIPSVASTLELKVYTYARDLAPVNHVLHYLKPKLLSDLVDEGYSDLPTCP